VPLNDDKLVYDRLWHDGKNWWMWDGKRFKQQKVATVWYVCIHQLSTVYGRLRAELETKLNETTNKEEEAKFEKLLKSLKSYNTTHEVDQTLKIMQGEMFLDLAEKLDSNPDILNVRNGVINLRTGHLDIHRPEYLCTKMADVNYKVRPKAHG
jgi:putative DNA primase/helicase